MLTVLTILFLLTAYNIQTTNGEVLGKGTSFQCIEGNEASNEYCSSYCTTVTSNLVSGKCGKDLNSCICLTSDNKSIMVRVVESKEPIPVWKVLPQQSKPPSDVSHQFVVEPKEQQQMSPQLLVCDESAEASNVCNSFCLGVSAQYGICNTSNYQCVCYGVPPSVVQDQPIPAIFNPNLYHHQDHPMPLPEPQHEPAISTPIPFKNEPLTVEATEKPSYQLLKPQIKETFNLNVFKQGTIENEPLTRGQIQDQQLLHQQHLHQHQLQQQQMQQLQIQQQQMQQGQQQQIQPQQMQQRPFIPQQSQSPFNSIRNYPPFHSQFPFPYKGFPMNFQQHSGQAIPQQEDLKEDNSTSLEPSHPIPPPFPFPFKPPFYQQAFPIQTHPIINSNKPTVLQPVPSKPAALPDSDQTQEPEEEEVREKRQKRSRRSPISQVPFCTPASCVMECDNRGYLGCSSDCREIGCYCSCLPGMGQNPSLNNVPFQVVDENAAMYDPGVRPPLSPPARPQHVPLSNFMYRDQ